jgi:hypothetical protein
VSNLRSSLLHPAGTPRTLSPTSRRTGTVSLELQSAYKFGLAMLVGLGGILADLSSSAAGLILIVAVLVAGRALTIIARDPADRHTLRPTGEADWDATLATAWGVLALVLAADGSAVGALVAGGGAVALAFLRLRTRYVL